MGTYGIGSAGPTTYRAGLFSFQTDEALAFGRPEWSWSCPTSRPFRPTGDLAKGIERTRARWRPPKPSPNRKMKKLGFPWPNWSHTKSGELPLAPLLVWLTGFVDTLSSSSRLTLQLGWCRREVVLTEQPVCMAPALGKTERTRRRDPGVSK